MISITAQAVCLLLLTQATGVAALALALVLVTVIFAEIPITTWLIGHYLDPGTRARAVSVEYVLSPGVGSAVVPTIAVLLANGVGFNSQFLGLACAALGIFLAALFLPNDKTKDRVATTGAAGRVCEDKGNLT